MSCTPGKVQVEGVAQVAGEKVFVLKMLQARNAEWANEIFFAKFDDSATWLDQLRPAFGASKFFFEARQPNAHWSARAGTDRRRLQLYQSADAE